MTAARSVNASEKLRHRAGIYIHVPFCLRKCRYCNFFSVAADQALIRSWVEAVSRQIAIEAPQWQTHRFATLFFGGGTPSLVDAESLIRILAQCRRSFPLAEGEVEITLEANPATIDGATLLQLRRFGFNRLSIGIQSFNDHDLDLLGRPHNARQAVDLVLRARRAGFSNISLDLMYGLPGQDAEGWQRNLDRAMELTPEHLSLYELTIEEGTPFAGMLAGHRLELPAEEEVLAMMERTATSLTGMVRYEISNFCRPGFACRHNLNYWDNGNYLGLGPAAVSCREGRRMAAVADIGRFADRCRRGETVWESVEQLDPEAAFRETVIMGLRLIRGIEVDKLEQRFAINLHTHYQDILPQLLEQNLVIFDGTPLRLRLSRKGLALANTVMAMLV